MARVYYYEKDNLTDQDLEELNYFYDIKGLEDYIEPLSDPTKGALKTEALEKNPLKFIKLWVRLGINHPGLYLQAFMWGTVGYLYPSADVFNRWSGLSPWNEFSVCLLYTSRCV